MFGITMPWTKKRLLREQIVREQAKAEQTERDERAARATKAASDFVAYKQAHIAKRQGLNAQAAVKQTPRPGYVTDYTSNSDSDELAMFAAQSFLDGLASSSSASSCESSSSSSDSDSSCSSSSDSGSSSSDTSSSSSSDCGSSDSSSW